MSVICCETCGLPQDCPEHPNGVPGFEDEVEPCRCLFDVCLCGSEDIVCWEGYQ